MVFEDLTNTATELIALNGTPATLTRTTIQQDENFRPVKTKTTSQCTIVVFPRTITTAVNSEIITRVVNDIYISSDAEVVPEVTDVIESSGKVFVLDNVKELNPNTNEAILYIAESTS